MVYVDELQVWQRTSIPCFRDGSCHMTADSLDELHRMALRIGLKRAWFQDGSTPHYDLTPRRREVALSLGAVFRPAREQARERIARRRARS